MNPNLLYSIYNFIACIYGFCQYMLVYEKSWSTSKELDKKIWTSLNNGLLPIVNNDNTITLDGITLNSKKCFSLVLSHNKERVTPSYLTIKRLDKLITKMAINNDLQIR